MRVALDGVALSGNRRLSDSERAATRGALPWLQQFEGRRDPLTKFRKRAWRFDDIREWALCWRRWPLSLDNSWNTL
jgi:hypothetical protein